ncbi:MAG TPA: hypothetical protein VJ725_02550 [Thermoanaerobaculia bacterium]|nr:hypothetical protein [Thermoanaerobaculia bacterium]
MSGMSRGLSAPLRTLRASCGGTLAVVHPGVTALTTSFLVLCASMPHRGHRGVIGGASSHRCVIVPGRALLGVRVPRGAGCHVFVPATGSYSAVPVRAASQRLSLRLGLPERRRALAGDARFPLAARQDGEPNEPASQGSRRP